LITETLLYTINRGYYLDSL